MADLVVLVPTRERPGSAASVVGAFRDTCTADTRLVFVVDDDDPTREEYSAVMQTTPVGQRHGVPSVLRVDNQAGMVTALNMAALAILDWPDPPFAVGFMGDDHLPRTTGWDSDYLDALRELGTGIVYGDDLLQGQRIPTQCAMTTDIVWALGHMAPPSLTHLYVDNYWLDLGTRADCIRYLPDVVIEHRHPIAGKVRWDAGYARVNNAAMYERDAAAYDTYCDQHLDADVAKVKALR